MISQSFPNPNESQEYIIKNCILVNSNEVIDHKKTLDVDSAEKGSSSANLAEQLSEPVGWWKKYAGFFLTLLSGLLYSLAALVAKLLNEYHPFSISIWRFQGVLLPCVAVVLFKIFVRREYILDSVWPLKDKQKAKTFYILFLRGLVGTWGVVLQFYSLIYLDVSDSMVITSSTSVFVTLMAHCFIGEKCSLVPFFTAALTFAGVFVISRPPVLTGHTHFDTKILIGVAMAFGCMVVSASTLVFQRYLREVHYSVISLSSGIWGTIQCVILALALQVFELPKSLEHWLLAVLLAALTYAAQAAIVIALKYEQAGPVAVFQSCDVISAFLWQFVFLAVVPDLFSLIGSIIVVTGVLLTAIRKYLIELPPDNKSRTSLKYLICICDANYTPEA